MKNIGPSLLSFCAGALLVAAAVAAWPVATVDNAANLVVLNNSTPAERAHCDLLGATAGHRLYGPTDKQGFQTSCILKLYGRFNATGTLVLARELRNPLDLQLLTRTSTYGTVPKNQIQHSCPATGAGAGCAEFGKWLASQYPGLH